MLTPAQYAKAGTEHAHQVAVFMEIQQRLQHQYPVLRRLHAVPNGGLRSKATAGRLKAEGVKSGVPDLFLPAAYFTSAGPLRRDGPLYHGCYIEMKAPGKLKDTSPAQEDWHAYLSSAGFYVTVCDDWEQCCRVLVAYVSGLPLPVTLN